MGRSASCWMSPVSLLLLALSLGDAAQKTRPPYVKQQCKLSSPKLTECLISSLHHLRPYFVTGIPEIEFPSTEPFVIDSLSLQLTGGDKGYRVTLNNMAFYGISNFTVQKIKLGKNGQPFEARVLLPRVQIKADYTSSGTLLILPATGRGDFHGTFENVLLNLKGIVSSTKKGEEDYLHLDKLDITIAIKNVKMHVENIYKNNKILAQATNLFLEENGNEVVTVMMPQLRVKFAAYIVKVINQLVKHTPLQLMTSP